MADLFFVKVLSAAVKVVRRAEDGSQMTRHVGFDASGKPVLAPATRTVILQKGEPIPEDAAEGELEKLQAAGVVGRKAAVTVVESTAASATEKQKRKPSTSGTRRKAAKPKALGELAGLSDKKLQAALEATGVKKLLDAVGADAQQAQRVLDAERARGGEPRATLVKGLEKVIAGGGS
jgi:hypothetical protein